MLSRSRTYLALLVVSIALLAGCSSEDSDDVEAAGDDGKADGSSGFVVNGHALTARERQWMQYVADHVLPHLPGTRERQLQIASRAAWWSLKEGTFDTQNPAKYSNCNTSSGDRLIGALDVCGAGRAWQVGLAAVQVPNHSLTQIEAFAREVFPDKSLEEVLAEAAGEAGFAADSSTALAIVGSTGSLRKSWLLRNSAVGFTVVERGEVVPECITGSLSWCYGSGWDTTRWYAPNKAAALRAIADISRLLDRLTSGATPAVPWIGTRCATDEDCGSFAGAPGYCWLTNGSTVGFCSRACEGYCPDQPGRAPTFCIADGDGGSCVVKTHVLNHSCADLAGTQPRLEDRYVGTSGVPAATATVSHHCDRFHRYIALPAVTRTQPT